jgi:hypothetical protein
MGALLRLFTIAALAGAGVVGCSSTRMNETDPNSTGDSFERYFGKAFGKFKNRKIYTELNREIIRSIPDEDLEQAIRDFIAIRIGHDWAQDVEKVPALGPGFAAVYFLGIMGAEVSNGGFNQLFYNSGRAAVLQAKHGADLLGLSRLSSVISTALNIEETERAKMARVKEAGTLEAFFDSYDEISFEAADDAFFSLKLDLQKEIVSFIRNHSELFEGRATD